MRIARNRLVTVVVASLVLASVGVTPGLQTRAWAHPGHEHTSAETAAEPQTGVQIIPATLTLSLEKSESQKTESFNITNYYSTPITLNFSFGQTVATPGGGVSATKQLAIAPNSVTIPAGGTVQPAITFTDSEKLAPGSQQVELIISQAASGNGTVSIIPSVRMPLITIKQDGAVAALNASSISKPAFAFDIPRTTTFILKNTGNIISIPRGFVRVTDPRGREVSKGIVNAASAAVVPGGQLRVSTPLTVLDHAWLPGMYRVQVSYGQGGGQKATVTSVQFFYFPLWQLTLLVLFAAMITDASLIWFEWKKLQRLRKAKLPTDTGQSLSTGKGTA